MTKTKLGKLHRCNSHTQPIKGAHWVRVVSPISQFSGISIIPFFAHKSAKKAAEAG